MSRRPLALALGLVVGAPAACQDDDPASNPQATRATVTPRTIESLAVLQEAKVLFNHQSVGDNIIEGLENIAAQSALKIVRVDQQPPPDGPAFAHLMGGRNRDPKSKVDAFAKKVREAKEWQPDVALMKFCYIDFEPSTNPREVLDYYAETLSALQTEMPQTRFVHATVPLKVRKTSLKQSIYRTIGRRVWSDDSNAVRNLYNEQLVARFGADTVFDIAALESTRPDGSRVTFEHHGDRYLAMDSSYTDDGGHLNQAGRRRLATAFAEFLAGLLER